MSSPGAPLTYFNDEGEGVGGGGGGPIEVHISYQKSPNFRICLPKNPNHFSIPKKIPVFVSANLITNILHKQQIALVLSLI